MQTFLDRTPHRLWSDPMRFVVFHLFGTPIFRNRNQCLHAIGNLIGKEHHFAVDMTRGATSRLNERGLAAQESLFIRIENADERNLWEIETFSEQIDADKDVEIGRPQSPQD